MVFIIRRTWLAGADPTAEPDLVRTVGEAATAAAGEARAEMLARNFGDARFDPEKRWWWAKASDALHAFQVVERPPRRRG